MNTREFAFRFVASSVLFFLSSHAHGGAVSNHALTAKEKARILRIFDADSPDIDVSGDIASNAKFSSGEIRIDTRPAVVEKNWCGSVSWIIPFAKLEDIRATRLLWNGTMERFYAQENQDGTCPARKLEYFTVQAEVKLPDAQSALNEWQRLKACALQPNCQLPDIVVSPADADARRALVDFSKSRLESIHVNQSLSAPSLNFPRAGTRSTLTFTYIKHADAKEFRQLTLVYVP